MGSTSSLSPTFSLIDFRKSLFACLCNVLQRSVFQSYQPERQIGSDGLDVLDNFIKNVQEFDIFKPNHC